MSQVGNIDIFAELEIVEFGMISKSYIQHLAEITCLNPSLTIFSWDTLMPGAVITLVISYVSKNARRALVALGLRHLLGLQRQIISTAGHRDTSRLRQADSHAMMIAKWTSCSMLSNGGSVWAITRRVVGVKTIAYCLLSIVYCLLSIVYSLLSIIHLRVL